MPFLCLDGYKTSGKCYSCALYRVMDSLRHQYERTQIVEQFIGETVSSVDI